MPTDNIENVPDELREPVPADIVDQLNGNGGSETYHLSVSTDIRLDGTYGEAWVVATDKDLIACSPNGESGPEVVTVPLSEISEVEVQDLFGRGALKVRTRDHGRTMALFSKTLSPKFSGFPDQLETLVNAARPDDAADDMIKRTVEHGHSRRRRRCEKCGQVIPHWMSVCPACLNMKKLFVRLISLTVPYWKVASSCLVLLLLATFIGLTPPLLMRTLIDDVLAPAIVGGTVDATGSLEQGGISGEERVAPPVVPSSRDGSSTLVFLVFALLAVNVSRNGLGAVRSYFMAKLGQQITYDLRNDVYRHLHRLSLSFYNGRETGRIMASITQDVSRLQDFISEGLQQIIRDVASILIICAILFSMDPWLATLVLLPTPILILVTRYFGNWFHTLYHALWRRTASISSLLADTIPGIRVVKAFAQEEREVDRFERRSKTLMTGEIRVAKIRSVFTPIMTFTTSVGTLIIWWVGGLKVLEGSLTLGSFTAFTAYMWQFYGPVESLCHLNNRFQRAATSAERVFEVLDTQPDVADASTAIVVPRIQGRVEFRDVTFSYDSGKPVLEDLNFTVEPGEMIGLAGHSGAGKSTLINLICRFYDVQEGAILVDGQDIRNYNMKSMRDQIGVVLQEPFLFNGTVADNIAYGKPGASMDEIVAAAKAANSHEFIMHFPEAYDTIVGERGARVSGGERQRISIARAILREPRILILDEATASVDTQTESQIQDALARLVKGRTTFAIAHRLSTLKNADRLLIVDKGKLAEIGTHDELLEKDGIYARLCKMQAQMSQIRAV
jgi:ATP-binding cassette subfamily B protein